MRLNVIVLLAIALAGTNALAGVGEMVPLIYSHQRVLPPSIHAAVIALTN